MAAERTEHLGTHALEEVRPLKVRAFFGVPVPEEQREKLGAYVAECSANAPEFRWTPPANMHLTVRFIGAIDHAEVDGIAGRLDDIGLTSIDMELGDLGTFKRGRLVRVVWLQLRAGAEQARVLAAQVEAECLRAGLEPEARPFQPHLTLARARPRDGSVLTPIPNPPALSPWRADELVLYRSQLGRGGSVYEALRRIRLR